MTMSRVFHFLRHKMIEVGITTFLSRVATRNRSLSHLGTKRRSKYLVDDIDIETELSLLLPE